VNISHLKLRSEKFEDDDDDDDDDDNNNNIVSDKIILIKSLNAYIYVYLFLLCFV
jgi:hypothetical protein